MRGYGQYCPISRAAEVLATRWTPVIVRNLVLGCKTFSEIAEGAPRPAFRGASWPIAFACSTGTASSSAGRIAPTT